MNRLALAQRLHLVLGAGGGELPGTLPITTVGQTTGTLGRLIHWVDQAWEDIQRERKDWLWMLRTGTLPLIDDVQTYPLFQSSAGITAAITGRLATATTAVAHGLAAGSTVVIGGATEPEYNGTVVIYDVPSTTTFRYLVVGAPATPATGVITYTVPPSVAVLSITGIVSSFAVVTVTAPGHDLNLAQTVNVTGATPAAYNGVQTIVQADANTFKYLVALGTATPATGTLALSGSTSLLTFDEVRPWFAANSHQPYLQCYRTSTGVSDTQPVYFMEPFDFDGYLNRASFATSRGRPVYYTILPGRRIAVFPRPDVPYTMNIRFRQQVQTLTTDTSEPDMPTEFHMAIVHKAAMDYGSSDENNRQMSTAAAKYAAMYEDLCIQQLPRISGVFGARW